MTRDKEMIQIQTLVSKDKWLAICVVKQLKPNKNALE